MSEVQLWSGMGDNARVYTGEDAQRFIKWGTADVSVIGGMDEDYQPDFQVIEMVANFQYLTLDERQVFIFYGGEPVVVEMYP